MLRSKNRLKSSAEFDRIYREGTRFRGEYGMLICDISDKGHAPKFGFVVNKKMGNAVERHSYQRKLRHIVRDYLDDPERLDIDMKGFSCSFVAYKQPGSNQELKEDLLKLLDSVKKFYESKR